MRQTSLDRRHGQERNDRRVDSPTITVLVTAYNYGAFVADAIGSILQQDYPPEKIQIVVVDDGSTDDTSERVARFGPRVEYFFKANGGQASALNLGLSHASGEIIALLDADDMFAPDKLKRIAAAFQQDTAIGMVYHPITEWDARSGERRTLSLNLPTGDLRSDPNQFLTYYVQPASAAAFRRRCLEAVFPIPEAIRMLADAYWIILVPLTVPILALAEPLTLYRIHGSNSFYADEPRMPDQVRIARGRQTQILTKHLLGWLAENRLLEAQPYAKLFKRRWALLLQSLQFEMKPPGRWRSFFFLFEQNYTFRSFQSWKFTGFKYLLACSALVLGYKKAQDLGYGTLERLRR